MKINSSLSRRDRTLLLGCLAAAGVLIVVTGIFMPQTSDQATVPSSYSAGVHGAKAAYLLLLRSGYDVERWERPLSELAVKADSHTVLILAQPFLQLSKDTKPDIQRILDRGGHILATGYSGGYLLPQEEMSFNATPFMERACTLQPEAFNQLAAISEAHMPVAITWDMKRPAQRVEFTCANQPAVVSYHVGPGSIVWWASATPLENAGLMQAGNLDLFLSSVGSPENMRVYWDESLHGDIKSLWSHAQGTPVYLIWAQAGLLALLLLLSKSRRSGPVRPIPEISRSSPLEFVTSLGALYQKAGATNTAVTIAYERFRHRVQQRIGFAPGKSEVYAQELATAIERRSGQDGAQLREDLTACEQVTFDDRLPPRVALKLVQALHDHASQLQFSTHPAARKSRKSDPLEDTSSE